MGDTFRQIVRLVERGEVRISEHGYDELAADGILAREIVASISDGVVIEEYSDYAKGPYVVVRVGTAAGSGRRTGTCGTGHCERRVVTRGAGQGVPAGSRSVGCGFREEAKMNRRKIAKLVHEGDYVAEVEVEAIQTADGGSPYLSVDDAYLLDDVRDALKRRDLKAAARLARVYKLTPVAA